jgi:hypothetical protein
MPNPAFPCQHTVLNILMGSPQAYQAVANMGDWQPLPSSATEVDVSSHSTNQWDQWTPTTLSGGKPSFPVYWIPGETTHEILLTYYQQRGSSATQPGTPIYFRVDFPDAAQTTWKYQGFVTGLKFDAPVKGVLKATTELRITGQPNFNADRITIP